MTALLAAAAGVTGRIGGWKIRLPSVEKPAAVLTVIGVGRLSWEAVLSPEGGTRMLYLNQFVRNGSAVGDIMSFGYQFEPQILASVVTGRLPLYHGITSWVQQRVFDSRSDPCHMAVWERLSRSGTPVAVVGFPFCNPFPGRGAEIVPEWTQFSRDGVSYRDGKRVQDPAYAGQLVLPGQVPARDVDLVLGGRRLAGGAMAALRAGLAADLTTAGIAEQVVRRLPEAHLFVYLRGMAMFEDALRGMPDGAESDAAPAELVVAYHAIVDRLLRRLDARYLPGETRFIFSEEENRGGPVHYRPRFPDLIEWPPIGFFAARGLAIKRSVLPETLAPVDLAVTMLYLAGAPIPASADGVIRYSILDDDFFFKHPIAVGE